MDRALRIWTSVGRCAVIGLAMASLLVAGNAAPGLAQTGPATPQDSAAANGEAAPAAPSQPPSVPGIMIEPRGWSGPQSFPPSGQDGAQGCPVNSDKKLELIV